MEITIKVPSELEAIIPNIGNVTKQKSLLKIYNGLCRKSKYQNKEGWFEVSAKYLHKINGRYKSIIQFLIENNIIELYYREYAAGELYGDLFNSVKKKSYSAQLGICLRYRFLININKGKEYTIEINWRSKDKNWYKKLNNTLVNLGYTPKISRDSFGGRVYHNLTMDYKEELKGKGLAVIDAQCSQPRLLYLICKERGIYDKNYFDIFENNRDFYFYLVDELNLSNRDEAKEIFMYWALGNGYTKGYMINKLFPVASKLLKTIKGRNYKDSSRYLSSKEASIWIDDLLENVPTNFVLTIHDSFIVKQKDGNKILEYCQNKYPELIFKLKEL